MTDEQKARIADIARLVAPQSDRVAFLAMLENKLRGREEIPDHELRRVAEDAWREFLRNGWGPPNIHGPEDSA
jgi:hypothetical protein